jgi:hypothetical protein
MIAFSKKADKVRVYPNVAKTGGLQSQGVMGEVVVVYLESFFKNFQNENPSFLPLSKRLL